MTDLLAFVGSARAGGNTDVLVDEVLRGAAAAGASAVKVRLIDLDMAPCLGCMTCTAGSCRQHDDDVGPLLERMVAAQGLLFATPVYFWNVSGLMKTLWDRMLPLAGLDLTADPVTMDPLLRGKVAGTVVVQEEAQGPHASIIRTFFERNLADFGVRHVGELYAYGALERGAVRGDAAGMAGAFDLGRDLARALDGRDRP